jgi:hypothetical protein
LGIAGAGVGGVAGGIGGSALMPLVMGRANGPSVGYAAAGLGLGVALYVVAELTDSGAVGLMSAVTIGVGMPLGAAIGIHSAPERKRGVAVLPMVGERSGLVVTGRF